MMKKILHVLDIQARPHALFQALTLPPGLAGWWTTVVHPENDVLKFQFDHDFNPKMRILRQEPDQLVHWQCVNGYKAWHMSTVTFTLEGSNGSTHLTFIHNLVSDLSNQEYGRCNFHWGYYLDSLRRYCETGQGKPFPG